MASNHQPKHPCCCQIIPEVVFKSMEKQGIPINPTEGKLDQAFRMKRTSLMFMARAIMESSGNAEISVYDSQNTGSPRIKLMRKEGESAVADKSVNAAYDNGAIVRKYFKEVLKWHSVDNNGMDMVFNVHFLMRYNNAFWDGEQMSFGDGDGTNFTNFVGALDVIGHELAHGVVQHTANLEYKGQSGALNEHFADVFGSAVKQWHLKQTEKTADWMIGEVCLIGKFKGKAIRSMMSPADEKIVMMAQPDHMSKIYKGTNDNGGVHINSGIPNRAFYLVAMDIGTQNAALLWMETLKTLKPSSKFKNLHTALKKMSSQMVKNKLLPDTTVAAVDKAFKAVGIIK
jgi:Zn-dependent metalloprotease